MMESLELFEKVRAAGGEAVMATLIAAKGPTPRKAGARMFVGRGGQILGSVTIGGCVDALIVEESEEVMRSRLPKRLKMALGDEDAWEVGLTCGGNVEVLIEYLDFSDPTDPLVRFHEVIRQEMKAERHTALATLVSSSSGEICFGKRMLIDESGKIDGALAESAHEPIIQDAFRLMAGGKSQILSYDIGKKETVEVFIEIFGPPFPLIIFGGNHLAMALVSLAKTLGFRTVVVDGRPRFANRERFPEADEVIEGIPSEVAEGLLLDARTSLVLLTHDYKYEIPVLKRALATNVGYIGLLGSRRRGRAILDLLHEQGSGEDQLQRIHVPVGLDIGAESAPEIALSILAEIVMTRNGKLGGNLSKAYRSLAGAIE